MESNDYNMWASASYAMSHNPHILERDKKYLHPQYIVREAFVIKHHPNHPTCVLSSIIVTALH